MQCELHEFNSQRYRATKRNCGYFPSLCAEHIANGRVRVSETVNGAAEDLGTYVARILRRNTEGMEKGLGRGTYLDRASLCLPPLPLKTAVS